MSPEVKEAVILDLKTIIRIASQKRVPRKDIVDMATRIIENLQRDPEEGPDAEDCNCGLATCGFDHCRLRAIARTNLEAGYQAGAKK